MAYRMRSDKFEFISYRSKEETNEVVSDDDSDMEENPDGTLTRKTRPKKIIDREFLFR
jgi:hypothetical protein